MVGKFLAVWFACAAFAQTGTAEATANAPAPTSATSAPARAYAFDVISIRQNKTLPPPAVLAQDGPTADGYRSHQGLLLLLLTAYVPQVSGAAVFAIDQVKGIPDWIMNESYSVDARIADVDRAEWQKPAAQKRMLQSMLQALLADRCKLVAHREVKESRVTSLVLAKDGPKFKETDPSVEHPGGRSLPFGGVVLSGEDGMSFYDTSMASLASFVSSLANQGRLVQDRTGLNARYDFALTFRKQSEPAEDADPEVSPLAQHVLSGLNKLGMKLESERGPVETLAIDHMERPSEN